MEDWELIQHPFIVVPFLYMDFLLIHPVYLHQGINILDKYLPPETHTDLHTYTHAP